MDQVFGDYSQIMRAPDLRLSDVRVAMLRDLPPFGHQISDPNRCFLIYARRGTFLLDIEDIGRPPFVVPTGTTLGFETGRAHRWRVSPATSGGVTTDQDAELFVASIPRRMGVVQRLQDGMLIVPPDAEPFATSLRLCVELFIWESQSAAPNTDDGIILRCAEICMMQFVRYVRTKISAQPDLPPGLEHDEHLLRAWTAYFADPRRRWTVQTLAEAAGLCRSTFAERFHRIFGAPPLQTLTELRLEQAERMLCHSKAPLIEVAFTVGYNSEAAFVRAFHRKYGIPPGKFRTSMKTPQERPRRSISPV